MLRNRSLIILVVVLVVLAAVYFAQQSSHRKATSRSDTSPVLAADFDAEQLSRIAIGFGQQKEAVVLENLPDGWVVRTAYSHKASQQRMDGLLNSLTDLAGDYRSDSPEVLADYGFTDSTTVSIAGYGLEGDEPIFSLEIGKKPQRSVGNFVKTPGSNAVYLTRKGILNSLGLYGEPEMPQSKHFLELTAHKCDRLDVESIRISDGDQVIALQKEFTEPEPVIAEGDSVPTVPPIDRNVYEWKITEPVSKTALKTKGDQILSAVSTVRAVDIDDPAVDLSAYGLDNPQRRAEVVLQDGSTIALEFGGERPEVDDRPGGFYMRVVGDDSIWIVKQYQLDNIFKKLEDLLPEAE